MTEPLRCGWCDERPATRTLVDGDGLCTPCYQERRRQTRGYPNCPYCGHRFWMEPLTSWGYRCLGCGSKLAGESRIGQEERGEAWPPYRHPFVDHTGRG